MKQIYNILFLLVFLSSCGQKKEQLKNTEEMQTALIEKYTEQIWSEMTHYEIQPAYYLRLYQTNCTFEVFVNGLRAYKGYKLDKIGSAIGINPFIISSGKQEVVVRMYPLGNLLQEEYGKESHDDILILLPKSNVEVKVTHISDLKTYQSPSKDEKTLLIHNSPIDNQKEFVGQGLSYYEYSFDFDAEVPYENIDWRKGVDLSLLNQGELKKAYIRSLENFKNFFLKKDVEGVMDILYKRYFRISNSNYYTKDEIINELNLLIARIYMDKSFLLIKNSNLYYDFTYKNKILTQKITNDFMKVKTLKYPQMRGHFNSVFLTERGSIASFEICMYMPKEYEGKEIHLEYMP